jgi:hypothetical protein
VKSTTGAPCSQRGRGCGRAAIGGVLIDSSVNACLKGTPNRPGKHRIPSAMYA